MSKNNDFALVPRPAGAVESAILASKRIVTLMVTETLALEQARTKTQSLSALEPQANADLQNWYQKGESHYSARGVPKDYEKAAKWFRLVAKRGHSTAQYFLDLCYGNGRGVPQDYAEAAQWYPTGAEQGNEEAQSNLPRCCEEGLGVLKNPVAACKRFKLAGEQGRLGARLKFTILSAAMSPAVLAASERLYEEYSKRKQS
ncbi:MAG: tetratricopeptide repeat protein [Verrucomicrobia bacterium]|nr:tetratricopeptide repeat protein [Verrucomicrobiota bacterium]